MPTSTSSKIIQGTFAFEMDATRIARLKRESSPPDAALWIGLGSAPK